MKKIALLCQKGGVGKSTISINLAHAYARSGSRVLLIDCDPQHSSLRFFKMRSKLNLPTIENLNVQALDFEPKNLPAYISKIELSQKIDVVIFDCPPRADNLLTRAIVASCKDGLVLIPVRPSALDLWASEDTFKLLLEAKKTLSIEFRVLFSQVKSRATLTDEVKKACSEMNLPVLKAGTYDRAMFSTSISNMKTVFEDSNWHKAAGDINHILFEANKILD